MSHTNTCLNCERTTSGNFCFNCGQKTDTHRITFKHFIFHYILHGVWHFEKGILFTINESLFRSGEAALDYISGKRIRYYNVFYLTLLISGLNIFLSHFYDTLAYKYLGVVEEIEENSRHKSLFTFLLDNAKIIILSFIPLFAINSFFIFNKKRLNFSEHFIIAGMIFLGVLTIVSIESIISFLDLVNYLDVISASISNSMLVIIVLFLIRNYYYTFNDCYSLLAISWRIALFFIVLIVEVFLFAIVLMGFLSNWNYGRLSH